MSTTRRNRCEMLRTIWHRRMHFGAGNTSMMHEKCLFLAARRRCRFKAGRGKWRISAAKWASVMRDRNWTTWCRSMRTLCACVACNTTNFTVPVTQPISPFWRVDAASRLQNDTIALGQQITVHHCNEIIPLHFAPAQQLCDRVTRMIQHDYFVLCERRSEVHPFLDVWCFATHLLNGSMSDIFFFQRNWKLSKFNFHWKFSHERRTMAAATGSNVIHRTGLSQQRTAIKFCWRFEKVFFFFSLRVREREWQKPKKMKENKGWKRFYLNTMIEPKIQCLCYSFV